MRLLLVFSLFSSSYTVETTFFLSGVRVERSYTSSRLLPSFETGLTSSFSSHRVRRRVAPVLLLKTSQKLETVKDYDRFGPRTYSLFPLKDSTYTVMS